MALPVQIVTTPPFPLVVTEVSVEPGELEVSGGLSPGGLYVPFTDQGELVRKLILSARVNNQSTYPVTQLDFAIQFPTSLPDDVIKIMLYREADDDHSGWWERVTKSRLLEPQAELAFRAVFYVRQRKDLELTSNLSDVHLRVVGIKYEAKKGRIDQWWDEINTEWLMRGVSILQLPIHRSKVQIMRK